MTIHYVEGDVWVNRYNCDAIAHGVNLAGVMGAGIALEAKRRYPLMFNSYKVACSHRRMMAGWVYTYPFEGEGQGPRIINLTTQLSTNGAQMSLVIAAFCQLRVIAYAAAGGLGPKLDSIAIPQIGAGLGGLDWRTIKLIAIQRHFGDWEGDLYVYEKYIPGK